MTSPMMIASFLACCALSALITAILVKTAPFHARLTGDNDKGPQKIHLGQIPRIGGVTIYLLSSISATYFYFQDWKIFLAIICAATPAFLIGIIEDLSKSIRPTIRLIVSLFSGVVFIVLTDVSLSYTSVGFIDYFLKSQVVSIFITVLAIATMVNAINIIDGLNGLSLGTSAMIMTAFSLLAYGQGDMMIFTSCLFSLAAIIGLLLFNFPFGRIFTGDGGAYFLGALIAMLSILISARNGAISPFSSLLIILYPLYELSRSIVRRSVTESNGIMQPDHGHFHSLAFRLVKSKARPIIFNANATASCLTLLLPAYCCLGAILFYDKPALLLASGVGFIILYEGAYRILLAQERDNAKDN